MERFPRASADNPPFFDQWRKENEERKLRVRLEEILGPLTEDSFVKLRERAASDFCGAIDSYLERCIPDRELENGEELKNDLIIARKVREEKKPGKLNAIVSDSQSSSLAEHFLGSFQAEIWSTRSGADFVSFGDPIVFRRSVARKNTGVKSKPRDDTIVRVANVRGVDFARVSEGDAKFMSVLMDTCVCKFTGTTILADEKLRLGDLIVVQVDCYLLATAFDCIDAHMNSELDVFKDESREQASEQKVRLRQTSLCLLFARLGLAHAPEDTEVSENNVSTAFGDVELARDQVDLLYRTVAGSQQSATVEADPASSVALSLFPYQRRGLAWMLQRENGDHNEKYTMGILHPLWTEFKFPDGQPFYANMHSGELAISRPTLEGTARGGILADEMGLGKTISMLSLVHTAAISNSTLIVVPMSLLSQWASEVYQVSKKGTCRLIVYYNDGTGSLSAKLHSIDRSQTNLIVLTSYGVVASEHKNSTQDGLFSVEFDRVVLDEAHTIKNRTTKIAKACFALQGRRRWALTGTPIVNRLEDLYSLVRFLQVEPWNSFAMWQAFVTRPFEQPETREQALQTVQSIVAPLCLRRTKNMTEPNGEPLVTLPERTVEIRRIEFSTEESDLYNWVYNRVRTTIVGRIDDGTASRSYTAILALVMRLRQVCDHPLLLKSARKRSISENQDDEDDMDLSSNDLNTLLSKCLNDIPKDDEDKEVDSLKMPAFTAEVLKKLQADSAEDCIFCGKETGERLFTECMHSGCIDCLMGHIDYQRRHNEVPACHMCRKSINPRRLMVFRNDRFVPYSEGPRSAKVKALIQSLRGVENPGKSVVFSQFVQFLNILATELEAAGFRTLKFDGSMSQQRRTEVLDEFRTSTEPLILLLSLKAGGVGLNLVCAQRAFIMDPWWSWAIESQAIDRIHRLGQQESVHIVRFIVQGSIEERMLKIQDHKRALSSVVTAEHHVEGQLDDIRLLLDLDD